jgi:hypothetical protein
MQMICLEGIPILHYMPKRKNADSRELRLCGLAIEATIDHAAAITTFD